MARSAAPEASLQFGDEYISIPGNIMRDSDPPAWKIHSSHPYAHEKPLCPRTCDLIESDPGI
jgi:hypothetical protein